MRIYYILWTANHHAYTTDIVKMSRGQGTRTNWVEGYWSWGKNEGLMYQESFTLYMAEAPFKLAQAKMGINTHN